MNADALERFLKADPNVETFGRMTIKIDGQPDVSYAVIIRPPGETGRRFRLVPEDSSVSLIAAERQRQIAKEGYSAEHDDEHEWELSAAASAYALAAADDLCPTSQGDGGYSEKPPAMWPPGWEWKPTDPKRMLVKAGALIVAEIDRLVRLEAKGEE